METNNYLNNTETNTQKEIPFTINTYRYYEHYC